MNSRAAESKDSAVLSSAARRPSAGRRRPPNPARVALAPCGLDPKTRSNLNQSRRPATTRQRRRRRVAARLAVVFHCGSKGHWAGRLRNRPGNSGGSIWRPPTSFGQPEGLRQFIDSGRVLGLFQQGGIRDLVRADRSQTRLSRRGGAVYLPDRRENLLVGVEGEAWRGRGASSPAPTKSWRTIRTGS